MKFSPVYLILILTFTTYAQVGGERIYTFLNIPGSARQAALGGDIYTMNDDVNQPLWNPASINRFLDNQASINYVNYLGDLNMGSVTFAHLITRRFGTLHAGIQYLNYGDFIAADVDGTETGEFGASDLSFSLGYGYQIPYTNLHLGINLKYLNSTIENYTSSGFAGDLGIYYFDDYKPYTLAAVLRNVGYQISLYDEDREDLPMEIAIAGSYKLEDVPLKWHLTLSNLQSWSIARSNPSNSETDLDGNVEEEEINFFEEAIRHVVVGAEFFPDKAFNVRLGYNFRRAEELSLAETRTFAGFSAGFGLKMGRFKFDYAYTKYHPVTNSNTISLLIDLTRTGF